MLRKVVIAEAQNEYASSLKERLEASGDFLVCDIFSDGESVAECMKKEKVDMLVLDAFLPRKDALSVLSYIDKNINVFVTASKLNEETLLLLQEKGAARIFEKPVDVKSLEKQIRKIFCLDIQNSYYEDAHAHIARLLKLVSISPKLKGYRYLKRIILLALENGRGKTYTELLRVISSEMNTASKNIDRNIRTAIESAWTKGSLKWQYELFGYSVSPSKGRPTNKEFISMIVQKTKESLAHR